MDFRTTGYKDFRDEPNEWAAPPPPRVWPDLLWAVGCGVLIAVLITRGFR